MANKINFILSDKLVVDGSGGYTIDKAVEWNDIELASPLSVDTAGKVHPFVATETFIGVLSYKGIKNTSIDIAGVNTIEVSYLKGGYFLNVRAVGAVAIGDKLEAVVGGFSKTANDTDPFVGVVASVDPDSDIIKVRGGNY